MVAKKIKQKMKRQSKRSKHDEAKRKNIPTAEHQSILKQDDQANPYCLYTPQHATSTPSSSGGEG